MKLKLYSPHKSTFGIDANFIAGFLYLIPGILGVLFEDFSPFTFIIPTVIFFAERKSDLVKFHALQYLVLSLASNLVNYILFFGSWYFDAFYVIASYAGTGITLTFFGFLITAMVKAFCWRSWRVPLIGGVISKIIGEEIEQ